MHAHNYFTINKKGDCSVYFNSVLSPKSALKRNVPFSNYIALGSGAGLNGDRLNNMVFCSAVVLGDNNRNPAKGVLRATFVITAASSTPITFTEIVLCENADGSGAVSYTTCKPTVVSAEPIEVSVTIFAEVKGDAVVLDENNRAFANWMLGIGSTINASAIIITSYNDFPGRRSFRVTTPIPQAGNTNAVITFADDYLEYKGNIGTVRDDICMYSANVAYLRGKISFEKELIMRNVKCTTAFGIGVDGLDIDDYMNVSVDGEIITDYDIEPRISGITGVITHQEFNFGEMAQIKDCGSGRYVAVATNAEVYLLDYNIAGFTIRLKVAYNGEEVIVCKNGSLILWGDSMKIYRVYDGAPTIYSEVALCKGSVNAVVSEGAQLHAARIFNKKIERYKVFGGSATLIDAFDAGEKQMLVRNGKHIFWHGPGCPCGSASIIVDFSGDAAKIEQFYANNPGIEIVFSNENQIVYKAGTGLRICTIKYGLNMATYDPYLGNSLAISHAASTTTYNFNPIQQYSGITMSFGIMRKDKLRVVGIADVKHFYIILLENGEVQHYKVSRRLKTIISPKIVSGSQVGYMAVGESYPTVGIRKWLGLRIYYPGCEPA